MWHKIVEKSKKVDWNKAFNITMAILAVVIIGFSCFYDNNLLNLINTFPSLNVVWLIISFLSIFVVWFLDSSVIYNIANSLQKEHFSIFKSIKTTMVGQYFSSITPFGVAGQPMQLFVLTREGLSSTSAISLLVSKFLIYQTGLASLSFIVIITVFFIGEGTLKELLPFAVIGFVVQAFTIILLAIFSLNRTIVDKVIYWIFNLLAKIKIVKNPEESGKKLREQLDFYLENNKRMNKDKKLTAKLYLLSILQMVVLFSIPLFIYKAYNNDGFPFLNMLLSQSFVTMVSSYTPLPGGSGSSESSFILVFNMFFDYSVITQAMLLWRFITYYSCIIFGAFFARVASKDKKKFDKEQNA